MSPSVRCAPTRVRGFMVGVAPELLCGFMVTVRVCTCVCMRTRGVCGCHARTEGTRWRRRRRRRRRHAGRRAGWCRRRDKMGWNGCAHRSSAVRDEMPRLARAASWAIVSERSRTILAERGAAPLMIRIRARASGSAVTLRSCEIMLCDCTYAYACVHAYEGRVGVRSPLRAGRARSR